MNIQKKTAKILKNACSVEELLQYAGNGEKWAALELGLRVSQYDFCIDDLGECCPHAAERDELQEIIDNEYPPDCPHCGKLVDALPEDYEEKIVIERFICAGCAVNNPWEHKCHKHESKPRCQCIECDNVFEYVQELEAGRKLAGVGLMEEKAVDDFYEVNSLENLTNESKKWQGMCCKHGRHCNGIKNTPHSCVMDRGVKCGCCQEGINQCFDSHFSDPIFDNYE